MRYTASNSIPIFLLKVMGLSMEHGAWSVE